jgi:hypothetical protein
MPMNMILNQMLFVFVLAGMLSFSDISTITYVGAEKKISETHDGEWTKKRRKFKKGDTLTYCQVLRLTDRDKKTRIMTVFANSVIRESKMRSKLKIDYMMKRERVYLHKVFFFDVDVLDEQRVDTSIKEHMNAVYIKHPNAKIWCILNADGLLAENRL